MHVLQDGSSWKYAKGSNIYKIISKQSIISAAFCMEKLNEIERNEGGFLQLTKKHKTALQLLFEGDYTKDEIAKIVKVSRTTMYVY